MIRPKLKALFIDRKFLRISLLEWVGILLFFLFFFILLVKVGGGPVTSDEFYYMNLSLNGLKSYLVLNYYFHIYLQRVFLLLAPSALAGAKYFWAFLFTATSFLIYLSTRWMSKGKSIWNAILSFCIFFSISTFPEYSGAPKIDFTTSFVVSLIFAVSIFYQEFKLNKKIILIVLGFLFFLALKTKETSLFSAVVLIGFGFDEHFRFSFREFIKIFIFVLPGFIVGGLFFILLNWLCVRDPLFGIRPQDFITYLNITAQNHQFVTLDQNWLSDYVIRYIPLAFILYLWGGLKRLQNKEETIYRFIWLYPALLLGFLVIVMLLTSGFKIADRNFFPALPAICIFASQVFWVDEKKSDRIQKKGFLFVGIGFVLAILLQTLILQTSPQTNWNYTDFSQTIIIPLVILIVFSQLIWNRGGLKKTFAISIVCLSLGLSSNLVTNFKSIVVDRPVWKRVTQMFYPFSAFKNSIHFSPQKIFYISPSLPWHLQMLSLRKEEIFTMFNIYFKTNSTTDNFIFPATYDVYTRVYEYTDPIKSIAKMDFDEAIIAEEDWQRLQAYPEILNAVEAKYLFQYDDTKTILFLH